MLVRGQPPRTDEVAEQPKHGLPEIALAGQPLRAVDRLEMNWLTHGRPRLRMMRTDTNNWPERPSTFPDLMTPLEAAMYLRLDQVGHTPASAHRTLNYWRDRGELKATKYARRIWFLKGELEVFLRSKTEAK